MYVPGDEPPFAIDIYQMRSSPFGNFGESYPVAGDAPVAHADFGAATAPFDPGDLNGSEAWAAFRAGKPATEENKVWYFGGGITDGGRLTVVMSSSDTSGDPADKHLGVQVGNRDETNPIGGEWSLAPTLGTLIARQLRAGCRVGRLLRTRRCSSRSATSAGTTGRRRPASRNRPSRVGRRRTTTRRPGQCRSLLTLMTSARRRTAQEAPQTDPISANIPVGGYGYVFVYSTDGTDLKGFFVPPVQ